jgi:hypothetical protein
MGKMSDLMIDLDNERIDRWITERLGDDVDGESEEYGELAEEYYNLQEHLREQFEFEEDLEWLKRNDSSIIHRNYIEELTELEKFVKTNPLKDKPYIGYRMAYAHAVALLEGFLGDTVKSLVNENSIYFTNSRKVAELKSAKYSLDDLVASESNPKNLAIKELSKILYHNIPKAKRIFEIVLDKKLNIKISDIVKITNIRHDIVHRNGKTKDGDPLYLDQSDVMSMLKDVKKFVDELQRAISKSA